MKSTGICPKCDGRKVYAVSPVQQTYCDAQGTFRDFNLTGAHLPTGEKTLFGGVDKSTKVVGPMTAFVCAACGYTEWYTPATSLSLLERMASEATGLVTVVQSAVQRDPFR